MRAAAADADDCRLAGLCGYRTWQLMLALQQRDVAANADGASFCVLLWHAECS